MRDLCAWCGNAINPTLSGPDGHPTLGSVRFHFSCSDEAELCIGRLANNIAIAAALCASFDCGSVYASRQMSRVPFRRDPWEPGCGNPAPVGLR